MNLEFGDEARRPFWSGRRVIDCDLHNEVPSLEVLKPYLADHWCAYIEESAFRGPDADDYPKGAPTTVRPGLEWDGEMASQLSLMREQVLDPLQVDFGVLDCAYRVQGVHNPDLAAALASAINGWQAEHWLNRDPRLRASIVAPTQNPVLAAREIDGWGDDPRFVQVVMPVRSLVPYGNRMYDPIYEAADRHGLVVGIQFGGAPGHPPTPSGWLSTYLEEYAAMAQVFQSQVTSLIVEGVFDRFPNLRVALIEAGCSWMPSLMWRLDKEWRGLRRDIAWVKRPPSDYIRQHIRLTLQPMDGPPSPKQLLEVIGQLDSEEMLMFATDHPHWHFDRLEEALPGGLSESLIRRVLAENARSFYRL